MQTDSIRSYTNLVACYNYKLAALLHAVHDYKKNQGIGNGQGQAGGVGEKPGGRLATRAGFACRPLTDLAACGLLSPPSRAPTSRSGRPKAARSAGPREARPPAGRKRRRRAVITDAIRSEVKKLIGGGQDRLRRSPGRLRISLPSVQNIKKA